LRIDITYGDTASTQGEQQMDSRIKFAKLISLITSFSDAHLSEEQIERVDYIVSEDSDFKADPRSVDELLQCMKLGKKIDAIKQYRALTGQGLKESKDAVEAFWTYPPLTHPQTDAA
jgi:ribosomal protein L7/L12